jgi:Ser/Thr protein kinase RdoA (MazF antagonist)
LPSSQVDSEEAVAGVVSREFGLRGTIGRLESEVDETFRIDDAGGTPFLIKLARAGEAEEAVGFQTGLLLRVQLAAPDLPVPRLRPAANGAHYLMPQAGPLAGRIIRVISFLPGQPLRSVRSSRRLREQVGRNLALLGRALRGYDHPAAHRYLVWDIQRMASLRPMASAVDPPERRQVLLGQIDRFEDSTAPVLSRLRAQVVHNDFNSDNILVGSDGVSDCVSVTGILDFGDASYTPLVNDVAVMAAYQLSDEQDPTATAIDAIAGYHAVTELSTDELALLPRLIIARMVARVIVPEWRAKQAPANRRYLLRDTARAWTQLNRLLAIPDELICQRITKACPTGARNARPG